MIDTATNTVVSAIPVTRPSGVAITADGKHAYVTNLGSGSVSVIETVDNKVVSTVPLPAGANPAGIAITPDGTRVYVANNNSNNVSVIQTAANKVVGNPIPVGTSPVGVGIIPPPQGVQFLSFNAKLDIKAAKRGTFDVQSEFTLSSTASNGIHPESEPVKLQVGPFITTIPAGSFREHGDYSRRSYSFEGVIDGVRLEAQIKPTGTLRYAFQAEAKGANLSGTNNPLQVSLSIGDDAGLTLVNAKFDPRLEAFDVGN